MCGIAGIIGADPGLHYMLPGMLQALRHRGPDGEGQIAGPRAVFGHRRLSVIDLEGGRQPLTNEDQSVWLVCNGEIYNHRELRATLEAGVTDSGRAATPRSSLRCMSGTAMDSSGTSAACSHSRCGTRVVAACWRLATTWGRSRSTTRP